jgi:large subunit ribosomal protein L13
MNFKTKITKAKEVQRVWHLFDAKDYVLGRLSVQIASLLMGKNKPYLVNYLDCGDYVVVVNAGKVQLTGQKLENKVYHRHSGYPGGFKEIPLKQQMVKDPTQVIRQAVTGMLPKNKLRDQRLSRLKIFADSQHPFEDKFKQKTKKDDQK